MTVLNLAPFISSSWRIAGYIRLVETMRVIFFIVAVAVATDALSPLQSYEDNTEECFEGIRYLVNDNNFYINQISEIKLYKM